jgi:hypothetical protein
VAFDPCQATFGSWLRIPVFALAQARFWAYYSHIPKRLKRLKGLFQALALKRDMRALLGFGMASKSWIRRAYGRDAM